MERTIDLNADLGEGRGDDEGLMAVMTSANIACGGHAGDEASMRTALQLARTHGVSAGAHPAYPDRENFGRQSMEIDPQLLEEALVEQLRVIAGIAREEGMKLGHIKPHGALYNDAAGSAALSDVILCAADRVLPDAALVGLPLCEFERAAKEAGKAYIAEGFADRAYAAGGRLVPRREPGAVIEDDEGRTRQALALAAGRPITAITGEEILIPVRTICLHGDSPGALNSARSVRASLKGAGIAVRSVKR